jgi:hypothetical protein
MLLIILKLERSLIASTHIPRQEGVLVISLPFLNEISGR